MDSLIEVLDQLQPYGAHASLVIFLILLLCGFGLPMPEDVLLIACGILIARKIIDPISGTIVCFAGVMVGDSTVFLLGRYFGVTLKKRWPFRIIFTPAIDARVKEVFEKSGKSILFLGRFMPGLRTPIFFSGGVYHVPFWRFFALDGLAALISVPVWIAIGVFFGNNLEQLGRRIFELKVFFGVLIFAFIAWLLFRRYGRRTTPLSK